jgi:hypothetical protein
MYQTKLKIAEIDWDSYYMVFVFTKVIIQLGGELRTSLASYSHHAIKKQYFPFEVCNRLSVLKIAKIGFLFLFARIFAGIPSGPLIADNCD